MTRKRLTKQKKSNQLLSFIMKNPGLTVEQISKSLGWTNRSVRLVLGRLEKIGQISPRYYPVMTASIEPEHPQLEKQISSEESKLEKMLLNLQEREKETFEKCVRAKMAKDEGLASMYANQCAEIRRLIDAVAVNESLLARMSLTLKSLKLRSVITKETL